MSRESLKTVFTRRDKALEAVWSYLSRADAIDADVVARCAEIVISIFPSRCRYDAVFRTLLALVGVPKDKQVLRTLLWAAASNVPILRNGEPVVPGRVPIEPTEVSVLVLAASRLSRRRRRDSAARFRGRIVSGPGTPAVIEWSWSLKFVSFIASRPNGFGFIKPKRNFAPVAGYRYQHFSTLVGMRCVVDVSLVDGRTKISSVRCPGSFRQYNRDLTAMRWRETFTCPFSFQHHCQDCPKGQNSCPVACRPLDLVTRMCSGCSEPYEHDPSWETEVCQKCQRGEKK